MEFDRQTKVVAINAMKQEEQDMAKRIDKLVANGELEEYPQRRGWLSGCFPWFWRGGSSSRIAQDNAMEVAVFGQGAANGNAANARLEKAAEQMENHAEQLYAKAGAIRAKAKSLMAQGKKAEAMAALKRVKALEKQAEVATSTHAAIEQQKDMLESSALQREVATALSASIATTKKKTKGLLEKAENAVDGSAELRDAVDDISEVMGGLATSDNYDEDELMEELELMARDTHMEPVVEEAPAPVAKARVEPQAIVVGIDPELYPKAPTAAAARRNRREQKQKLIPAESVASDA